MDYWLVLGLLLAGCGVGALLTAAVYLTQLKKVKNDLKTDRPNTPSASQVPDSEDGGPRQKSA
jgi:hypothetical protein